MAKQLLGIFLLQFDQPFVIHGITFHAGGNSARIFKSILRQESAGHDQVDMQINPFFLQLSHQIIEAIQPFGVEKTAGILFIVQQRRFPAAGPAAGFVADRRVRGMQANHIDTHAGKPLRQLFRGGMIRRIGSGGDIETKEAYPLAVFKKQVPISGLNEAVLAGGRIQQMGEIQNTLIGGQLVDMDMLLHRITSFFTK